MRDDPSLGYRGGLDADLDGPARRTERSSDRTWAMPLLGNPLAALLIVGCCLWAAAEAELSWAGGSDAMVAVVGILALPQALVAMALTFVTNRSRGTRGTERMVISGLATMAVSWVLLLGLLMLVAAHSS